MKKILKFIMAAGGVFLLVNGMVVSLFTNINMGNFACVFFGLFFVLCSLYEDRLNELCRSKILKILKALSLLGCVFFVVFALFLECYGKYDNADYEEDVLIVLGAGLRGESVTRPLAYRLNEAVEYLNRNKAAVAVVSGGQGNGETISEAEAMHRYLVNKGIAPNRIIKEDKSTSTYENFKFSKEILDEHFGDNYETAFVTNDFHVFRAERIGKKAGLSPSHIGAPLDWYVFWPCTLREGLAVAKNFVIGK